MGKYFSDKVEEGIRLVWLQYDNEAARKGFRLLEEAAEEGDPDGLCFLARCYMGGGYVRHEIGLPEDWEKAAGYLKESVLRGSAAGLLCAMRCGALTPSVRRKMPLTPAEARDIILEKAEAGEPFCQYMIGNTYFCGDVVEMDQVDVEKEYPTDESYYAFVYPKAAEWFERALRGGLFEAYRNLMRIYTEEQGGFPANRPRLAVWAKYGAERGCPELMNHYAIALKRKGMDQESFYWYQKAAEAGDLAACYNLAEAYEFGVGVEKDYQKAFTYYMESARCGDGDGCFKVGYFYYAGIGREIDYAKSVYWLQKGCDAGVSRCYPPLAISYQYGSGVQRDVDYAFELLSKAEKYSQEYSDELKSLLWHGLGRAYGFGEGVKEDVKRGVMYFQAALALGDETAEENLACFRKTIFGKWKRVR